ncbi:MAG TPA: NlpC/P60 family protein [Mycobacteriales bacterium]|nr:NlpC/P60 family protein [Mycobacteriales bacterium]
MFRATLSARLGILAASLFLCLGLAASPAFAQTQNAEPGSSTTTPLAATAPHAAPARATGAMTLTQLHNDVRRVLREAARQKGKPYQYGADGPHAFDCSGLVRFVFLHAVHISLPHNAAEQYHSLHHIRRRHLKPGDLVFVDNGYVSHVGIYDGHDYWWVAPHTGTHVQRQHIYKAHLVYAQVFRLSKKSSK